MSSSTARRMRRALMLGLIAFAMTGCGHEQVRRLPETGKTVITKTVGDQAAIVAVGQIGVPYVYGGNSVRGFDCSGLVQYAYAAAGMAVPRTTGALWHVSSPVPRSDLRAGDLLFFDVDGKMSHVGMYLGDRRFVHAPSSGKVVSIASLDAPHYSRTLIRAARPR